MKFSCTQENLKKGLMVISSVSGKNVNLPILNNVLMKVEATSITFLSTNLEIAVKCVVRGKVEEPGEITVPSKLLLDYVNLLPEDKVDISVEGDVMHVSCRKNSTTIKGLPAAEFPLIPGVERKQVLFLDAHELKEALGQVIYAVSGVESRPELTGVLFNVNPQFAHGYVVLAATDSYRLAERKLKLASSGGKISTDKAVAVIIPGKTLSELSRILAILKESDESGPVELTLGESQVAFRFGDIELLSRVIDGRYPDYRPIIPERFSTDAVVSRSDLVQAVKSASLFSRSGLQDVHLSLDEKQGLEVASSEGQLGKNEGIVEAKVTGQKNSITVNYRYFLDGVGAAESKNVRLRMIDAMNPCVVTPEDNDEFLYIVMPIKQ